MLCELKVVPGGDDLRKPEREATTCRWPLRRGARWRRRALRDGSACSGIKHYDLADLHQLAMATRKNRAAPWKKAK